MSIDLSAAEARRIALAAQGLAARPPAKPGITHVRAVAKRLLALQIDSVNVLVRAHYLPVFSRLGPYPRTALDALTNQRHELVELDAHQASFVPVELEPLLRFRASRSVWSGWRERMEASRPGYVEAVHRTVVERGPIALGDLDDPGRRPKPKPSELLVRRRDGKPYAESSVAWGRPSDGKVALDGMLSDGPLVLAGRGTGFERLYDLRERVVPGKVRACPTPSEDESKLGLVGMAAQALGVATVNDLAKYFGLKSAAARLAVRKLVDEGRLVQTRVEGWREAAFLSPGAKAPRTADTSALLGPFDSLTWSRDRTRRLFGFDYSFEIYVPAPKRRYGYYVLPFLMDEALVARVDLRAERKRSALLVLGAFAEEGADARAVAPRLAQELRSMAAWLGLDRVEVGERGDLARALGLATSRRLGRRR